MARALVFFLLFVAGAALTVDTSEQELKANGVAKVISLLKDMQAELEKEQETDEDLYDAFTCWCEANNKGKGKAIADAETRITDLTASIELNTAKGQQLTTEIAELKTEIKENEDGLEESTSLRAKEGEEFHQNGLDSNQAISNIKAAVGALEKTQGGALTQEALVQLRQVASTASSASLASLLQESSTTRTVAHTSGTGAIFGIIKQMKEEFEGNLVKAEQDEKVAVETFNEMKTSKTEEISAGKEQVGNKQTELADAQEQTSQAKDDLEDTTEQLAADQKFLADVKVRCDAMDKQWAVRTKVRQEETKAVGEALEILTDDDARDLMAKTTSFLQTSLFTGTAAEQRQKAANYLQNAAKKLGSSQLMRVASAVKNDIFGKVQESIDVIVAQLKKEQASEAEKKDWCRSELHENDMDTTAKYNERDDLQAKVESLASAGTRLTREIKGLKDEVAETQVEIQRANENRQKANSEFQATVNDQRATQEILAKAMNKLKAFYDKKASLLQRSHKNPLVGGAPPGEFKPYKKKGGAGGVVGMIEQIIAESKDVEKDAREGEIEEQAAYEQFLADSGKSIVSLQQEIVDKQEQISTADGDRVRAKEDLANSLSVLEDLNAKLKELHLECDFLTDNFETRQEARTAEMEALQQAKQMMSGASR